MVERGTEWKTAEVYTQGEIRVLSEPLLLRSAFGRQVQGQLVALNHFCFSLLSSLLRIWYWAISRYWLILVSNRFSTFVTLLKIISMHRIISNSPHFSTFASLVRAISRHRIILDSPRFSAFESLVQLWHFPISQNWTVWRKASAQSRVTSYSSSAGLLHSPFFSPEFEIFPG